MYIPRKRLFWSVSLGHMTNDVFMNMGPVLLAFLGAHILPMSTVQIGIAVSLREFLGAISQPLFGWLGDRSGGRVLGAGGVAWTVTMLMLSLVFAISGEFWLMIVPFALAALGSGAFHPIGAMHAAETAGNRSASSVSYFFLFGQIGLSLGPAIAGFLLNNATVTGQTDPSSLTPIFGLSLLAIPSVLFMAFTIPKNRPAHTPSVSQADTSTSHATKITIRVLLIFAALVMMRSIAHISAVKFFPLLFQRKGWEPAAYGLITSSFWMASALSGVFMGQLADRYDRRRVIGITMALAAPALFLLPLADGAEAFILAITAGGLTGGSFGIIVVIAQSLSPARKGLVSGMIMGFMFSSGALGALLIGLLADGPVAASGTSQSVTSGIGLETTIQLVAGCAALGGLLSFFLPKNFASAESDSLVTQTAEVN